MADRRKKGCPNPDCKLYGKKKFNSSEQFCGQCGEALVYVCATRKCFTRLEDKGPKHIRCERCDCDRDENIAMVKEKAGTIAKGTLGVVPTTFAAAGKRILDKEQSAAIDKIAEKGGAVLGSMKGGASKLTKKVVKKR